MRVIATRIEPDGTMQRRVVDTAHCSDRARWEALAARALAIPPPYRPEPGAVIYHLSADHHTVLVAQHDLRGPLLDLVTAVLALGSEILTLSVPAGSGCQTARWRAGRLALMPM
jgi:hypothetical protein